MFQTFFFTALDNRTLKSFGLLHVPQGGQYCQKLWSLDTLNPKTS